MNVSEAKSQIIELLELDLGEKEFSNLVNPNSPDPNDEGKFTFLDRPVRVIHRFNGWNVPINLSWFSDSMDQPIIKGSEFYWYAFAVPKYSSFTKKHYYLCDYTKLRDFVLDFDADEGDDYKDSRYWRADIQLFDKQVNANLGYFRWGDESLENQDNPFRIIQLDNVKEFLKYQQEDIPTLRSVSEVSRIVRDTKIAKWLKRLHQNQCQICGTVIGSLDRAYSEVHHVMPLGFPHNGPDVINNMLVLCPNHHAEFDYGFIAIHPATLKITHIDANNQFNGMILHLRPGHKIASEYLNYHNDNIFKRISEP